MCEAEFARVLAAASRDGSILSAIIRDAWDTGSLQNLTRKEPLKARGCHVAVVGDITAAELREKLSATEIANGFLNRFLIVCARRRQRLPHGGDLRDSEIAPVAGTLRQRLDAARSLSDIHRTEAADREWEAFYNAVPDEGGLLGAVTARAEAQVLRLSLVYALLDGRDRIDVEHLRAARAVWDYAHGSAQYVFGESLGNPTEQRLLDAAREAWPEGLDGAEQDRATGGRLTSRVREALVAKCLLRVEKAKSAKGGRPAIIVYAVPPPLADKPDKPDKLHAPAVNPLNPLNPQGEEHDGADAVEVRV